MLKYNVPIEKIPHSKGKFIQFSLFKSERKYEQIPANVILDKTLTGIGATYAEITDKGRNSIIIEPNVPVIKDKARKHENEDGVEVFPIHKGVTTYKIESFLKRKTDNKKKILTTPEGFSRLRGVARKLDIYIYKDYFCLFDECEKITQDVGYRKRIAQPVYDFFKFENKAFVSATPLEIRHPEIKSEGFKIIKIEPDYDYRENLDLIVTNTIDDEVCKKLKELDGSSHICIFFNSTDGISRVVKSCGLSDYKVFCSEDAKKKLAKVGIDKVESDFCFPLAKYNFFTSRFYSALDIELKKDSPDVLILTDLNTALHSMVDPLTEAIQIQGRFREEINGKRFKSLTHITNINQNLKFFAPEQLKARIEEFKETYLHLQERLRIAENYDRLKAIAEEIEGIKYNDLLDENENLNYFAVDNWYNEERVRELYTDKDKLLKAYQDSKYFNMSFVDKIDLYHLDLIRSELNSVKGIPMVKAVLEIIQDREDKEKLKQNLIKVYPDAEIVYQALERLGLPIIARYNYSLATIKKKLYEFALIERRFCPDILDEIYDEFEIGEIIPQREFGERLTSIYRRYGIEKKAVQSHIDDYFLFTRNNGTPSKFTLLAQRNSFDQLVEKKLNDLKLKWLK